jgi:general secretion pathway protein B
VPADNAPAAMAELPDTLRRQLPPLSITGVVYAANPAQRLLLVNGQVLPEGGSPAVDVTIESIGPRASVFVFRGTRFTLPHR